MQLPPQRLVPLPVLLEVNISGEAAKHGFAPDEIEPFLAKAADYRHVSVRGLMCMAGLEGGLDAARREFAALRELRDRLRPNCPPGVTLDELSMGMSGDFEVAIEEGATIVRVGSALFEGVSRITARGLQLATAIQSSATMTLPSSNPTPTARFSPSVPSPAPGATKSAACRTAC